jgi:hypothetical protein
MPASLAVFGKVLLSRTPVPRLSLPYLLQWAVRFQFIPGVPDKSHRIHPYQTLGYQKSYEAKRRNERTRKRKKHDRSEAIRSQSNLFTKLL